ncbi:hypothetical protein [Pseudonocardia sp. GCM10023141]|uniref:hypothetical protein n=1 Tax=Pseudonocardia sp. GCM10023141 TaxID=3252653 RepID=UPI003610DF4A
MTRRDDAARVAPMSLETKERLRAAARLAPRRYPGAVGELLSQELLSWMVFGHQLGCDLIMRVADALLVDEEQCHSVGRDEENPDVRSHESETRGVYLL